ncbi:integrase catalytic domain-containing protein [Trichonephila clavipes]|nr:integrase catalytic domain-containing protein [Trichonephila clavipes]
MVLKATANDRRHLTLCLDEFRGPWSSLCQSGGIGNNGSGKQNCVCAKKLAIAIIQSAIDYALAEIKNKRLDSETKLEFERIKLAQLQKELELANIQKNLLQNSDIRNQSVLETAVNINVETLLKSVKTLTIPVPSRVELYNLFFQSLEKAFKTKEVPEQFKGKILLNILGERVNNLLVHVSEEELNNYTVHIELVSDLTSQAFIAALKRLMARRGKCAKLFSDNGKNFVGAGNEIKKLLEIVRNPDEKLANYLAAQGIEWKFIPARSPNFGGLWEAAIKSYKYHLKKVVNGINLTYEELLTVTVQIEGILNARPLCPLSNNDDDFQVLTPAHFLINRSLNSLEEPNLTKCKETNLKRWQKMTKIVLLMWKFWSRNYLNQLQQRGKWIFEKNNVKIGDLVLIIEENLPAYKKKTFFKQMDKRGNFLR